MRPANTEKIEIDLLFEALFRYYGYDFRQYYLKSALRRVWGRVKAEGLSSIPELQYRMIKDEAVAESLLCELSINATAMFRDPLFYKTVRENILPEFAEKDHFKIWHAGCATGEEVYSMAIMLKEEGLYDSCRLYASDFNNVVLNKAKNGVFPLSTMQVNSKNYQNFGGKQSFVDYYHSNYDNAILDDSLKKNMIFFHHDLVSDDAIDDVQVVVCRNVLIYFNDELQSRVFKLFHDSLSEGGILCLEGSRQKIARRNMGGFDAISQEQGIYRKASQ